MSQYFIEEFKLNLNKEQIAKVETWLEILTFTWNRSLSIAQWRQYQDALLECQFMPRETRRHKQIPIPTETLDKWGFGEIAHTPFGLKKVGEIKEKNAVKNIWGYCFNRTVSRKVSLNDYPDIKSGNCHVEEFEGYTVYSKVPGLEHGFVVKQKSKKGVQFRLHYPGIYLQTPHFSQECPIPTIQGVRKINQFNMICLDKHISNDLKNHIIKEIHSKVIITQASILISGICAAQKGIRRPPKF